MQATCEREYQRENEAVAQGIARGAGAAVGEGRRDVRTGLAGDDEIAHLGRDVGGVHNPRVGLA